MRNRLLLSMILLPLFLCAENVAYIIDSRSTVQTEGIAPKGSICSYKETSTSGHIGQLTTGNSSRFVIKDLPNIIITDITLQMHSNTSSGSGGMEIYLNTDRLYYIQDTTFDSPLWGGKYTNTDVPVYVLENEHIVVSRGDSLVVSIIASKNSLYVSNLTITYHNANEQSYSVYFHTGTRSVFPAIRETEANAGVILPNWNEDLHDFVFVGWTDTPIMHETVSPETMAAGEIFYPQSDVTLYALYTDSVSARYKWKQTTDFHSGNYLIADAIEHCIATGPEFDGKVETIILPEWRFTDDGLAVMENFEYPEETVYYIEFLADSLATITNVSYDERICYSKTPSLNITRATDPWNYRLFDGKRICFYHQYSDTDIRYLIPRWGAAKETADELHYVVRTLSMTYAAATILFNIDEAPCTLSRVFTSFPLESSLDDIVEKPIITNTAILNPNGLLLQVYLLTGTLICSSVSDISLSSLPTGIHILRFGAGAMKVSIR